MLERELGKVKIEAVEGFAADFFKHFPRTLPV